MKPLFVNPILSGNLPSFFDFDFWASPQTIALLMRKMIERVAFYGRLKVVRAMSFAVFSALHETR